MIPFRPSSRHQAAASGDLAKIQSLLEQAKQLDDTPPPTAAAAECSRTKCAYPECKNTKKKKKTNNKKKAAPPPTTTTSAPLKSVCKKCRKVWYCGDYHKRKHEEHRNICGLRLPDNVHYRRVLNASQRWTESEYKASGFTKKYEWHGLTPLATAAYRGNPEIVEFLLKQGADPTLKGCPTDDKHFDALGAAQESLKLSEAAISIYLEPPKPSYYYPYWGTASVRNHGTTPKELAMSLFNRKERLKRSVALVEAAKAFWHSHSHSPSHYNKQRDVRGYPEESSDLNALCMALLDVPPALVYKPDSLQVENLAAKIIDKRREEQEHQREEERKRQLEKAASGHYCSTSKKQRRGFYAGGY